MFLTNEGKQLHLVVDGEGQSPSVSLGAPQEAVACPVEALLVCCVCGYGGWKSCLLSWKLWRSLDKFIKSLCFNMSQCINADKQKPGTIMSKGLAGMWCSAWHWLSIGVLFPQDLPIVWSIRNFRLHPQQANTSKGKSSSKWGCQVENHRIGCICFVFPTYSNHEFLGSTTSSCRRNGSDMWSMTMGIHHQGWLSGGPAETYKHQALELWYQFLLAIPYQYVANQERSGKMLDSWINVEHFIKKIYCQIAYSFEIHWRNPHLHKCFFTNCSLGSHLAKGQLSWDGWGNCTQPRMKIKSNIVSKVWLYRTRKVIGLLHNWSKLINSS